MTDNANQVTQDKTEFIHGIMNGEPWVWNPEQHIYISLSNNNENQSGIALYVMDEDDQELTTKLLNIQFENPRTYKECYLCMTATRFLVIWASLEYSHGLNSQEINEISDLLIRFYYAAKNSR